MSPKFHFTDHVIKRKKERSVSEEEVKNVVIDGKVKQKERDRGQNGGVSGNILILAHKVLFRWYLKPREINVG